MGYQSSLVGVKEWGCEFLTVDLLYINGDYDLSVLFIKGFRYFMCGFLYGVLYGFLCG